MLKRWSPVLIILAGCMWGTISWFVIYFDELQITDNITKLFIRTFGAALIFIVFLLFYDRSLFRIKLKDIWLFAILGFGCVFGFNVAFYYNISYTSANFATVLLYTSPIWVMLISIVAFKEKMTVRKLIALICVVLGCAFVSGLLGGMGAFSLSGLLIGLASGFGYGMYTILSGVLLNKGYHSLTVNVWGFFFATIAALVFGVRFDQLEYAISQAPVGSIAYMLLYAAVSSAISFAIYTLGLKYVEPGRAAIMAACDPVVGTIGALVLFSQKPTVFAWIGMGLVIIAIVLLNLPDRKKERQGQ